MWLERALERGSGRSPAGLEPCEAAQAASLPCTFPCAFTALLGSHHMPPALALGLGAHRPTVGNPSRCCWGSQWTQSFSPDPWVNVLLWETVQEASSVCRADLECPHFSDEETEAQEGVLPAPLSPRTAARTQGGQEQRVPLPSALAAAHRGGR